MFSVQFSVHESGCLVVNIAQNREHLQIAFPSGKGVEGALRKVIVEAILMFVCIKVEVPRELLVLWVGIEPLRILMHRFAELLHG